MKTVQYYLDHYTGLSLAQLRQAKRRVKRFDLGSEQTRKNRLRALGILIQESAQ